MHPSVEIDVLTSLQRDIVYWTNTRYRMGLLTVWGIYDGRRGASPHNCPFYTVRYNDHLVPIEGLMLINLWIAIEEAVLRSGEIDRFFIEGYSADSDAMVMDIDVHPWDQYPLP